MGRTDSFGAAEIRRLRTELSWTQARLGLVIRVHRSTVSRWECARQIPSAKHRSSLASLRAAVKSMPPKPEKMRLELAIASIASHSSFESFDVMSRCSSLQTGSTGQHHAPQQAFGKRLPNTFRRQLNVWSKQQRSGHLLVRQFQKLKL